MMTLRRRPWSVAARARGFSAWNLRPLKLEMTSPTPSDSDIASTQTPKRVDQLAAEIGLDAADELKLYGPYKAKVSLDVLKRLSDQPNGKYVVVGGMTPTPLGEGKTTCVMGLAQAFGAHLNTNAFACVRQPSQGPIFGLKDEFNMHLTGDIHAVSAATNLLAAAIDARMFHETNLTDKTLYQRLVASKGSSSPQFTPAMARRLVKLGLAKDHTTPPHPDDLAPDARRRFARLDINPATITVKRVVDTNDRFLRQITIGQGEAEKGQSRSTGFDIAVASELMAILALSNDLADLKGRIGRMVVAFSRAGDPLTVDDVGATGALTALLRDALEPTLMQTLEGTPVFVHAGPFANIAHGNSSILADRMALKLVGPEGVVVTEAGFGADMGIEKFCNIKCRASGLAPDCIVVVATIRALKLHGGAAAVIAGKPLPSEYTTERLDLVQVGSANLAKQIQNAAAFQVPVVVAISPFPHDSAAELELARTLALAAGAADAVIAPYHAQGGAGAMALAAAVQEAIRREMETKPGRAFAPLYTSDMTVLDKATAVAKTMYGASGVVFADAAQADLALFKRHGLDKVAICIAKTQYSLSHDPHVKGVPPPFDLPIQRVRLNAGAGFLTLYAGDISTMPGLPTRPSFMDIDVDEVSGRITGLF